MKIKNVIILLIWSLFSLFGIGAGLMFGGLVGGGIMTIICLLLLIAIK